MATTQSPARVHASGALKLTGSIAVAALAVAGVSAGAAGAAPTGTVMLSVLPLLVGFQLLLQALVLDIQGTPR